MEWKNFYIIITMILTIITLTGCEEDRSIMMIEGASAETIVSYTNFLSNCSAIYDVNISNAWGVCGSKHNVLTSLVSPNNWSVTCCSYTNRCYNDAESNFSNVCNYNVSDSSSFSWQYQDGGWVGVCCDFNTGLCYNQPNADINLNNTCQTNYTQIVSSIYQNSSLWNAWCCISGGLEQ